MSKRKFSETELDSDEYMHHAEHILLSFQSDYESHIEADDWACFRAFVSRNDEHEYNLRDLALTNGYLVPLKPPISSKDPVNKGNTSGASPSSVSLS